MTRNVSSNFINDCAQTHKSAQLIKENPIIKLPFLFFDKHRAKQQSGQTKLGRRENKKHEQREGYSILNMLDTLFSGL